MTRQCIHIKEGHQMVNLLWCVSLAEQNIKDTSYAMWTGRTEKFCHFLLLFIDIL
jgi:hypothetical protein